MFPCWKFTCQRDYGEKLHDALRQRTIADGIFKMSLKVQRCYFHATGEHLLFHSRRWEYVHNIEGCERANDVDALGSGQENPADFPGMGIRGSTEQ